ncbi:MAG: AhpC/TSA family protein [Sphingopyxis sp.]|nr:AhpC/TSA family protein [Sphingopyxis sp.]
MNLLKSVFIMIYLMTMIAFACVAGWAIYNGGDVLSWGGVLMATAPMPVFVGFLMIFTSIVRTSERLPLINVMGFIGVGLSGYALMSGGSALAFGMAVSGWVAFLVYAYWYSSYGGREPSAEIKIGAPLPAFALKSSTGARFPSAHLVGKPSILIFFRGNWCPLCSAQIKELAVRYQDLDAMGVRVVLISPQPHENTEALAKKFAVPFYFLTDEGNKAARTLGIAQEDGLPFGMQVLGYDSDTVVPTVIITDAAGKVIWTHQTDNYRVRPEPDVFLDVIRQHGLMPV